MRKAAIQPGYEIFHICNDVTVWIIASIFLVLLLILFYYFQQFERYPKWDWNRILVHGLGYCCCVSGPYVSKTTANRILFTVVLLTGIIFATLFIGIYLNKMQLQKEDYSIDEIYDGSYKLVADPLAYHCLTKQNQTHHPKRLKEFQICTDLQLCFDKLEMNTDVALATSMERANGLSSGLGKSHSIFEYDLKFLVRKEFPFREELNKFIGDALRSGLIGKWLRDHHKKSHFQVEERGSDVKVEHFLGVWMIYLASNGFCIFLIIAEKIVHGRVRQSKTISWFWLFAEILILPDRCFLLEDLDC